MERLTANPTPHPLDAAARDELARLLDAYVDTVRQNARIEGIESVGSWHDYTRANEDAPRADLFGEILALLASVRGAEADAARLRGLERFACVIVTRLSDGYEERFERGSDEDEPFLDWLDFVIANTEANQADVDAARAHPPTQETDADAE
jgi:hypothetical protein